MCGAARAVLAQGAHVLQAEWGWLGCPNYSPTASHLAPTLPSALPQDFFPLLTALISCEYAPPEVQRALSELFQKRIGPMLGSA